MGSRGSASGGARATGRNSAPVQAGIDYVSTRVAKNILNATTGRYGDWSERMRVQEVAKRATDKYVDAESGMLSDGDIDSVYESAFTKAAKTFKWDKTKTDFELQRALDRREQATWD